LLDRLVFQLARGPVGDGAAMILRLFTSQGDEGTGLLRGEGVGAARTGAAANQRSGGGAGGAVVGGALELSEGGVWGGLWG
jgi:hypothetical protein